MEEITPEGCIVPNYINDRHNVFDDEQRERISSDESFIRSFRSCPTKKVKTTKSESSHHWLSPGSNASNTIEIKNSEDAVAENIYTKQAHRKRGEDLFSNIIDWKAQYSDFKAGKHLSPELVDAVVHFQHFKKDKATAYFVFPACLWSQIESKAISIDFSIFEHKAYLIFPIELRRDSNLQWISIVIQRKSASWQIDPEFNASYYDSSDPRHPPNNLLHTILEAVTDSIFRAKPNSNCSHSLINNAATLSKITVPLQDKPSSSGIHMLYHIDQLCSNPIRWLQIKRTELDLLDIEKNSRQKLQKVLSDMKDPDSKMSAMNIAHKNWTSKKSLGMTENKNRNKVEVKQFKKVG